MKELQTLLGTDIPTNIRGILYICRFSSTTPSITVIGEKLCEDAGLALMYFANTPNPESQLITGKTYDDLIKNLHRMHAQMQDTKWLNELSEYL
jgi:hypothetical protein